MIFFGWAAKKAPQVYLIVVVFTAFMLGINSDIDGFWWAAGASIIIGITSAIINSIANKAK